jgi:hypothetical protein
VEDLNMAEKGLKLEKYYGCAIQGIEFNSQYQGARGSPPVLIFVILIH